MKRITITFLFSVLIVIFGVTSIYGQEKPVTYKNDIKPIIDSRCSACHGATSPLIKDFDKEKDKYTKQNKGPRMNSYALLVEFVKGDDAGAIMRRLDDGKSKDDKKPGNMYINLGGTEEERQKNLSIFKKWAGYWTLKRKKDITPDEFKKFKLLE